jgi:oligopeptidase B
MPLKPTALKRSHPITQHGITRDDEYYWMRDRDDPEVLKYLQSENEYLEAVLEHTKTLQETLFQEMKSRIKETDSTVPEKRGNHLYYSRTVASKQYPVYCRKKDSPESPEEILLDQNELADGHEFCSVGAFAVSPDGSKLAYSVDLLGAEVYTLHIKDLNNNSHFSEQIPNILGSVYYRTGLEWGNDNKTIFYILLDDFHRPSKLFRHQLGTDPAKDFLIFHEEDDTFGLSVFKTRSQGFIMTYHHNTLSQEMRYIAADQPETELHILQPREAGLEYYATHHGNSFFIITNENAPNYKLMKTPVSTPGKDNWQEVIPQRTDTMIEHIDAFEDHIVVHERRNGLKQIRISKPDDLSDVRYVSFPDPTYDVYVDSNPEFNTDHLRLRYSSLVRPFSIVDFDMNTEKWELLKEDTFPNGYDRTQYVTEYIHANTADDKRVPISLVYRKGLLKNGQNPTLLYGYGAYGASSDATFNPGIFSLLDRGFVFAIAHVRGGSELGRAWYDEGRLLNKKNSFSDFIACAEKLIQSGFTSADRLGITGGSAGGLLVGACMVLRPDLFKAVICKVPFLDVISSMSDPTIPLTTLEYDQWGNPQDEESFNYMLAYSPYDNIRSIKYPDLLLTTGYNDPRVAYWEPAKFAARIRDKIIGDGLVLLQTNFNSGHAGATGRYDVLKENVLDFAFLLDRLT